MQRGADPVPCRWRCPRPASWARRAEPTPAQSPMSPRRRGPEPVKRPSNGAASARWRGSAAGRSWVGPAPPSRTRTPVEVLRGRQRLAHVVHEGLGFCGKENPCVRAQSSDCKSSHISLPSPCSGTSLPMVVAVRLPRAIPPRPRGGGDAHARARVVGAWVVQKASGFRRVRATPRRVGPNSV